MFTAQKLAEDTVANLLKVAVEIGGKEKAKELEKFQKPELIKFILEESAKKDGYEYAGGTLEIMNGGAHGFLRVDGVLPSQGDVYVSGTQIQKFHLRTGDVVEGVVRKSKESEKYRNMLKVDFVGGHPAADVLKRQPFEKKTPIFPNRQIKLETTSDILSTRMIDMLSPIGFGQRGMIVAPPKAGKTWLLKDIANGITANNPNAKLMIILVGERPEEVTDIRRSVNGEVIASNFDETPENNTKVAEMGLEKAKRMVEWGEDVIILMDSITRLARSYNLVVPSSGRTLSGGFDPVALYPPKKFFGAARNCEEGGSLTILATALINTGSRMDDLIYEEFKGTGNMELHLDRSLAERRVYPSIDVTKSGTRREDLLLDPSMLQMSWLLRKMLDTLEKNNENPAEVLVERMKTSKSNMDFLKNLRA
ncbi:MAG: transcription termination factor Rho [Candidatus Dojkabacteria bacterium]|nr:MAG: transcription termination factor Rho [Candidatus Dojkabacteria bacterium]